MGDEIEISPPGWHGIAQSDENYFYKKARKHLTCNIEFSIIRGERSQNEKGENKHERQRIKCGGDSKKDET